MTGRAAPREPAVPGGQATAGAVPLAGRRHSAAGPGRTDTGTIAVTGTVATTDAAVTRACLGSLTASPRTS